MTEWLILRDEKGLRSLEGLRDGLPPEVRLRLNLRRHMTLQAVTDDTLYVDKLMERDNRKHGRNLDRPNTRNRSATEPG